MLPTHSCLVTDATATVRDVESCVCFRDIDEPGNLGGICIATLAFRELRWGTVQFKGIPIT